MYNFLQLTILGGGPGRDRYLREYVRIQPDQRVLDIGCGMATVLDVLPANIDYVGVDHSATYIATAREMYGDRATFVCADAAALDERDPFDVVMANGVLHHLNDDQVLALMAAVAKLLKPRGTLVTLDGAYVEGQSPIARWMLDRDRGQNVRTPDGYRALAAQVFSDVQQDVIHDLIRVPYTHAIMRARDPRDDR